MRRCRSRATCATSIRANIAAFADRQSERRRRRPMKPTRSRSKPITGCATPRSARPRSARCGSPIRRSARSSIISPGGRKASSASGRRACRPLPRSARACSPTAGSAPITRWCRWPRSTAARAKRCRLAPATGPRSSTMSSGPCGTAASSPAPGPAGGRPRANELDVALKAFGAKRLVIGHTPSPKGVIVDFDGKLVRIDTGISRAYGGVLGWIEIIGDRVVPHIHREERSDEDDRCSPWRSPPARAGAARSRRRRRCSPARADPADHQRGDRPGPQGRPGRDHGTAGQRRRDAARCRSSRAGSPAASATSASSRRSASASTSRRRPARCSPGSAG